MKEIRPGTVYIIGAGPGDPELLTIRGQHILEHADLVVYADSLVNPELLAYCQSGAEVVTSSDRDLQDIVGVMTKGAQSGKVVARLHSGDPAIYGAMAEQIQALRAQEVPFEIVPGVSAVFAAAAVIERELTVPGESQTVILTRVQGRASQVPASASLESLARHQATVAIFLSAALGHKVSRELQAAGHSPDALVCIVYRATWQDQQIVWSTVARLAEDLRTAGIHRQALILVGPAITHDGLQRSRLYDEAFGHLFRRPKGPKP
ncbi:precorrin-4 C(11)-methyltransferase [Sulfobacillus sp. hq2]|nr:precorrin-4 C(11)-methyltransferase [Sulfobacillus sp. hq2]